MNGQTATITIIDGTNTVKGIYTATVTSGAWSVNVTAAQAQGLADGSYNIKANVADIAGNSATTASQAIAVNETAPSIAIASPVAGDNIINKSEAAAGVTISGTATAGTGGAAVNGQTATITIVDSTNTVKDTYAATVTGGAWSVNVTAAQAQGFADGSYSIKANVSDAASNAATTASQAITVDETAPTIAITSPVAGDNIINKSEAAAGVTISGTAAAGSAGVNGQTATITIVDSTNAVKDTYTTTVTAGAWSVNVTAAQAQALADGSYSIKANVSDAAGNAATTVSQTVAVETLAPTVLISTTGTTTNQASQTISGTVAATEAAAGSTVTLFDTVNSVTTQIGTATVVGGSWSTTVTLPGSGTHSIVAQDTDAAGNIGSSTPVVFTLATAAPSISITAPVAGDNIINKAEAAAGVTVSGTAHSRHRRCGGQWSDRDDHDRRQFERRQGHLYDDGHCRGVVGQCDGGAGARLGRRQLQHQGECVGCGRQCSDHGDASNHGGRDRADDRDHEPGCRGQHHQQERGGGGRHRQWHGRSRQRGSERPDGDDHDRRQHQHGQGHLHDHGHGRGVVGERDGGAGAGPG